MSNILCFTMLLFLAILNTDAINTLKCNSNIAQPRCAVEEWAPNSAWYAYDQNTQKCILIRWSDECDSPGDIVNIYSSYKECTDECDWELKA